MCIKSVTVNDTNYTLSPTFVYYASGSKDTIIINYWVIIFVYDDNLNGNWFGIGTVRYVIDQSGFSNDGLLIAGVVDTALQGTDRAYICLGDGAPMWLLYL